MGMLCCGAYVVAIPTTENANQLDSDIFIYFLQKKREKKWNIRLYDMS